MVIVLDGRLTEKSFENRLDLLSKDKYYIVKSENQTVGPCMFYILAFFH